MLVHVYTGIIMIKWCDFTSENVIVRIKLFILVYNIHNMDSFNRINEYKY